MLICDPSYTNRCGLGNKTKCVGKVIRSIVITTTPIPNTKDIPSVQIILP
jgi:Rab GDP dissociation inhibitor